MATTADYDLVINYCRIKSVVSVVQGVFSSGSSSIVVVKSTVAASYTKSVNENNSTSNVIFLSFYENLKRYLIVCIYSILLLVGVSRADIFESLLGKNSINGDINALRTDRSVAQYLL